MDVRIFIESRRSLRLANRAGGEVRQNIINAGLRLITRAAAVALRRRNQGLERFSQLLQAAAKQISWMKRRSKKPPRRRSAHR